MLSTLFNLAVMAALAAAPLLTLAMDNPSNIVKDDLSPDLAAHTYDGCKSTAAFIERTRNMKSPYGKNSKGNHLVYQTNTGIQMAECHSNSRVINNVFSYFVIDPSKYNIEGAPYGTCTGWAIMPTAQELETGSQVSCGFWSGKKGGPPPSPIVGEKFQIMLTVCPSNLHPCYASEYYLPKGPLASLGSTVPTYKGRITSTKQNGAFEFCDCLDYGCDGKKTYFDWASHNLKCNVKNSCKPFKG